jgi:hypothetical protein
LEDDGAVAFGGAAFEPLPFDEAAGFDRAGTLLLAGRFDAREDLRDVFADFDFDLLVAIWLSVCLSDSIKCCHRHDPADNLAGWDGGEKTRLLGAG